MRSLLPLFAIILVLAGCKTEEESNSRFQHDIAEGPKPWTHENFEETEDDFTFALISDLNGGERQGVYVKAVNLLNQLDPTFVLSVGDLIDGGTEDTLQLDKEWDTFDGRTSKLSMPFFYLGGNHDLTNTRMRAFWKSRYGPRFYHFLFDDVLFLMMDSEDFEEERMQQIYEARAEALRIISGEIEGSYPESEYFNMPERTVGAMSEEQLEYFRSILATYHDVKWTFILMHKPLWMREGSKGLGRLEDLLSDRPYTVINGHFHSLSHRLRKGRNYTILGTTGGSQHAGDSLSVDHVTLIRMAEEPVITHIKMEGILNEVLRN